MKFSEYQTGCIKFANYPRVIVEQSCVYPVLGLAGEVGELQNKVKKVYRDDKGIVTESRKEEFCSELGDCLWYVSQICTEADLKLHQAFCLAKDQDIKKFKWDRNEFKREGSFYETFLYPAFRLQKSASEITEGLLDAVELNMELSDDGTLVDKLENCVYWITRFAEEVDLTLNDVVVYNLKKLDERNKKGVLFGSGDKR